MWNYWCNVERMEISTDLQLLVTPPMILEVEESQFTTRVQQLELIQQFEGSCAPLFTRLVMPSFPKRREEWAPPNMPGGNKRYYVPRPFKLKTGLTLEQFRSAFASCLHLHNIEPGDTTRGIRVHSMAGPMFNPVSKSRSAMEHVPLDVNLFLHQSPLLLDVESAAKGNFVEHLALFEKSFPDLFMRVLYPEHATHVLLAYMLRPEKLETSNGSVLQTSATRPGSVLGTSMTQKDILALFVRCLRACHIKAKHAKVTCLGLEEKDPTDRVVERIAGLPNECAQS